MSILLRSIFHSQNETKPSFESDAPRVELTAGNAKRALLPVKRVELQVHWAGKSERHPGENVVVLEEYCGWKHWKNGNLIHR